MIRRICALVTAALLLAGCVLQSETPLVAEAEGNLALGNDPVTFAGYTWKDGAWRKEEGTMTFTPEGHHYVASDGKSSVTVVFKSLPGGHWLMQLMDAQKPATYVVAEIDKGEVYPTPVLCTDLAKLPAFAPLVEMQGNDCTLKPAASKEAAFAALAAYPLLRELRMSPVR